MDALGQEHPLWIQEGLACLYEAWELGDDGTVVFMPNDRHDAARDLLARGELLPWPRLFAMTPRSAGRDAGRAYPQLRTFFRFLAARGYLESWYATYVEQYDRDATGVEALQGVLGRSLVEIDVEWRRWLES